MPHRLSHEKRPISRPESADHTSQWVAATSTAARRRGPGPRPRAAARRPLASTVARKKKQPRSLDHSSGIHGAAPGDSRKPGARSAVHSGAVVPGTQGPAGL